MDILAGTYFILSAMEAEYLWTDDFDTDFKMKFGYQPVTSNL